MAASAPDKRKCSQFYISAGGVREVQRNALDISFVLRDHKLCGAWFMPAWTRTMPPEATQLYDGAGAHQRKQEKYAAKDEFELRV
ncbi:MAG: hypothetical protein U0X87_11320 [Anaerolineales bacterium]